MTDDRHVRIREDGETEFLPTIGTFRIASQGPEGDAGLEAEYLEHNRRVGRMLNRTVAAASTFTLMPKYHSGVPSVSFSMRCAIPLVVLRHAPP